MHRNKFAVAFAAMFAVGILVSSLCTVGWAQTAVTGGLNGVVTDSVGDVVPNATVTVVNTTTGDTRVLTTNAEGRYAAAFLKPGKFSVSASATGLQSQTTSVPILVGQQSLVNLTVTPTGSKQVVTVSANNAQLIDTQSANLITTFTTEQFENLPNPGGDITTIAFTVPGVVVNTNSGYGYGNFSSDGLPGISNLIIINGADNTDSFLNLANTGASTLSIGQEEIGQASVVQNGYSSQYGRQAGAIETYVTKSGTNRVHGLLQWTYNSDGLNANDFFNNLNGTPRQKAVSNQYAAQIGGPILHNKLFFFADTEGIRYVTPTTSYVNFPTAAFQKTVLSTIPGASVPLYTQMFNLLKTSPDYSSASPVTTGNGPLQDSSGALGCGSYAGTPVYGEPNTYFGAVPTGGTGTAIPCMTATHSAGSSLLREWFAAGRVDWNISDKQKIFVRITDDQGFQPNSISLVNPLLNVQSSQPIWNGQLNHTYIFTSNLTNQFIMSAFHYSLPFGPANVQNTLAASPTEFIEGVDGGTNSSAGLGQGGIAGFDWADNPVDRNSTQYQFVDDLSWLKGNHNLKFGFNFTRFDVTDGYPTVNTYGGYYDFNSLADLASGVLPGSSNSNFNQTFDNIASVPLAGYNYGLYAQDEWKATSNLVVDYGVRVDRNGNPLCVSNCFSQYQGGFPDPTATLDTPYNATISTNHGSAFPSLEAVVIQPRAGFALDLSGQGKSVLRGGIGLFADEFPGALVEPFYLGFPNLFQPTVFSGNVAQGAGSASSFASASYNVLKTGFSKGLSANQLAAALPAGVPFSPPTYYFAQPHMKNAKYLEWSLQMQQQITPSDAVILSYAGNHGYDLISYDFGTNQNLAGDAYLAPANYTHFDDVPVNPPDPRFAQMGTIYPEAIAGYNGVSLEYKHIDRRGMTANISYTYSHALDDISNGGQGEPFNNNGFGNQIVPNNVSKLMYSNSDYDIRNNFLLDLTYIEPYRFQNKIAQLAAAGWTVAGKAYWRSGEPFSVTNTNAEGDLDNGTGNGTVLADVLHNNFNHFCNSFSSPCFQTHIFNGSGVTNADTYGDPAQTNFGNVPRNAFYGPHYADVDLSLYKNVFEKEGMLFKVGAQAFNLSNHTNFAAPQNDASLSQNLGVINSDVVAPTSPYGSFGSPGSGRVVVVTGRFTF
ncbi:MAG TPA: carboxypeptidase regulatory-like domain-containing protein [Acidobacteriaceae bacterium]|jgi:outer membrane receptor protein involved in Fe transport|nr:carboxypeptidase regulatory-like domain-containing protein [Acidobacteriaceae bacterium]